MPTTNLKNVTIQKLQDKNFNDYYLIKNNENSDEAYFAFEWTVKQGWQDLVSNWEQIREVEIEFAESEQNFQTYRKVISLYAPNESQQWLV